MEWLPVRPVVQAPMAGGGSTPALVAAVADAGGLGFLAAGYVTAARMRSDVEATRALTDRPFGVNVFLPAPPPADADAVAGYRERLRPVAARLGAEPGVPRGRDDDWAAKLDELLADPPAVVSFTFGRPAPEVVAALRAAGAAVVITVTSAAEARRCPDADALCVQGVEAGGHQGTFTDRGLTGKPLRKLLKEVRAGTDQPLLAAGGIGTDRDVADVLALGAQAAQIGTGFLRCAESGAGAVHKAALADPRFTATALTRAFSGRPARALVNRFVTEHTEAAPAAYPDVHFVTSPLRRAAAAQGDPHDLNLWAGTAWRHATTAPAAEIVAALTP
ncbi:nitronate monooxygenase [Actinomadura flavalba]|uniref:nitronate monooxygenase n=1 Tax=Actinomadura flavalba TaxID=1120938 RepID=UPI0003637CD7|nr:nitronate monooxygenase [Actinomadura flavalba]